jgi:hypothetical protein
LNSLVEEGVLEAADELAELKTLEERELIELEAMKLGEFIADDEVPVSAPLDAPAQPASKTVTDEITYTCFKFFI